MLQQLFTNTVQVTEAGYEHAFRMLAGSM